MRCEYGFFRKSCTAATGYIPVRATSGNDLFTGPLYLQHVGKYRRTVQAQVAYTLSKAGKHLSSLFDVKDKFPGWSYGDSITRDDALLVYLDGYTMEVFLFPGQRAMAEMFYRNVDKLPIEEIRQQARPLSIPKYERQLLCYHGKQMALC